MLQPSLNHSLQARETKIASGAERGQRAKPCFGRGGAFATDRRIAVNATAGGADDLHRCAGAANKARVEGQG